MHVIFTCDNSTYLAAMYYAIYYYSVCNRHIICSCALRTILEYKQTYLNSAVLSYYLLFTTRTHCTTEASLRRWSQQFNCKYFQKETDYYSKMKIILQILK